MRLRIAQHYRTAADPSPRVLAAAAMFGLGADTAHHLAVVPPTELELRPGEVVFLTGPSGGGKSTVLRLIAQAVREAPGPGAPRLLDTAEPPPLPDRPILDALAESAPGPVAMDELLRWLSLAGLSDAFVMLRRPAELSDGQRQRLRLAQVFAQLERHEPDASSPGAELRAVVLADEFGATLDRPTARAIAAGLGPLARRSGACLVVATTHDDLLEPLDPDVLIHKPLGEGLAVHRRPARPAEPRP